ncbi:MAG: hypothetical protein K2L28_04845 [Muribaculaceae bacterium]|nr:hypothetical protein [Muribaculaceae bacterium]
MKKFILTLIVFAALAVACDYGTGAVLDYLSSRAKTGQVLKNHEIADIVTPDILILGSSRSVHHFVPSAIEDSLKKTVYVAGQDGNGIVLMNPLLHIISGRHKPQTVIYDLVESFDIEDDDAHKYLTYLRPLWGKDSYTDSIICEVDPTERYKLMSHGFRYNSAPLSILKCYVGGDGAFDRGYSPLHGTMTDTETTNSIAAANTPLSPLKLELFKNMIAFCRDNGIRLFFTVSPQYGAAPADAERLVSTIKNLGGEVLDYSAAPDIAANPDYFRDAWHLNYKGAAVFTDSVIDRLKASATTKQ